MASLISAADICMGWTSNSVLLYSYCSYFYILYGTDRLFRVQQIMSVPAPEEPTKYWPRLRPTGETPKIAGLEF